jgi:hypothetical protein
MASSHLMSRSLSWPLSFSFPRQNHVLLFLLRHTCYMPRPPYSPTLIWSPQQYLVKITNHKAQHYAIFSRLPWLLPLRPKYFPQYHIFVKSQLVVSEVAIKVTSSVRNKHTACVLPLMWGTKFPTHTNYRNLIPIFLVIKLQNKLSGPNGDRHSPNLLFS